MGTDLNVYKKGADLPKRTLDYLNRFLLADSIITTKQDFCKDFDFRIFLNDINDFLNDIVILTESGYVNDPTINIPAVDYLFKLVKEHKLVNKHNKSLSNQSNIMFYYLILLLVLLDIINMESYINANYIECEEDFWTDLKTIKREVKRRLHPYLNRRIAKRGISIVLNTFSGFDSEFELSSSKDMKNDLLSIQLAVTTSMYFKVPLQTGKAIESKDLNIVGVCPIGENKCLNVIVKSIEEALTKIRFIENGDNDNFIQVLIDYLDKMDGVSNTITDDIKTYLFPKTDVVTSIKYPESYQSDDLVNDSDDLGRLEHKKFLCNIFTLFNNLTDRSVDTLSVKLLNGIEGCVNKPSSRLSFGFNNGSKMCISISRILYLCMHETTADLSMLSDFELFKENLDIIGRVFITRGKPLLFNWKTKVHIRDTILITPAGSKSKGLGEVGKIYGPNYHKIDIGCYRDGNMRALLKDDKSLFERYGIRDSVITLKHAISMEEYYTSIGKFGVPLTLSSISKAYVAKEWKVSGYEGYQIGDGLLLGDVATMLNPKNARSEDFSRFLVPFFASYRGGRNESFMYGVEKVQGDKYWYDYDLTSAYTSVMSIIGHPQYKKASRVYNKTVEKFDDYDFIYNYVVLYVDFTFPKGTKYPCIPTRVDNDVDIYPLSGSSVITGCEYLVAKKMGCRLYIRDGVMIPFKRDHGSVGISKDKELKKVYETPFRDIMKGLQYKRRQYPKNTFYNLLYKEIGNSIYGQAAMGLSGKKVFDIKTKSFVRLNGDFLSNPIIASYITGFTRALVGECLSNISSLKGRVVSATTDGFITDIKNLEEQLNHLDNIQCLKAYQHIRGILTKITDEDKIDDRALEVKTEETEGLISLKTRGQLGFNTNGILAFTGFQARSFDRKFLVEEFTKILNGGCVDVTNNKIFDFIQSGLRNATNVYDDGGHVIRKYKDQKFDLNYDNKRCIIKSEKTSIETLLKDSKPWSNVKPYLRLRTFKKTLNNPVHGSYTTTQSKTYKSYIETSVRGFIKACLRENCTYGIEKGFFKNYNSLIEFIYGFEPAREVKLSVSSISRLKNRNTITRSVPRTSVNESFINYVKEHIPSFDSDLFFKELSTEKTKALIRSKKKKKKNENIETIL